MLATTAIFMGLSAVAQMIMAFYGWRMRREKPAAAALIMAFSAYILFWFIFLLAMMIRPNVVELDRFNYFSFVLVSTILMMAIVSAFVMQRTDGDPTAFSRRLPIAMASIGALLIGGAVLIVASAPTSAEVAPYTFSGEIKQQYEPLESPLCIGEPVYHDLEFSVTPQGDDVPRIVWSRTWQRVDGEFGLVGTKMKDLEVWDYPEPFEFDFGQIPTYPPERVGAGVWRMTGNGRLDGQAVGAAYTVEVEYVECG